MESDSFFEKLAAETDARESESDLAPARLKSNIYSALVTQLAATGPLLSLSATKKEGRPLCVFEAALTVAPVSERVESKKPLPSLSCSDPGRAHGLGPDLLAALPLRPIPSPLGASLRLGVVGIIRAPKARFHQ